MRPQDRGPVNTKERLLAFLAECAACGDNEMAHSEADTALIEFINDPEITKAYDAVGKWYA